MHKTTQLLNQTFKKNFVCTKQVQCTMPCKYLKFGILISQILCLQTFTIKTERKLFRLKIPAHFIITQLRLLLMKWHLDYFLYLKKKILYTMYEHIT